MTRTFAMRFVLFLAIAAFGPRIVFAAADPIAPGSWTLAIIPDTQHYAETYPQTFTAQTQWIRDHKTTHNIQYALHLGDIVNTGSDVQQWQRARASMDLLNGHVPYALTVGNHEYAPSTTRTTPFNDPAYFGTGSPYASQTSLGGTYQAGKTDNSYHTFTVNGQKWLVLALEFGPRNGVVDWANGVVAAHPDHNAILVTHAYMYHNDTRYDRVKYPTDEEQNWSPYKYTSFSDNPDGVNDGQQLWDKLVSKHDNFRLVFSGHVLRDGTGYLVSTTDGGSEVHQMLSNYQFMSDGGQGFLRYLEFTPDGDQLQVKVRTYSPTLDGHNRAADHQFSFTITPVPEPSTCALGAITVLCVGAYRACRQRRIQSPWRQSKS
jgi:hypothetical protein